MMKIIKDEILMFCNKNIDFWEYLRFAKTYKQLSYLHLIICMNFNIIREILKSSQQKHLKNTFL